MNLTDLLYSGKKRIIQSPHLSICIIAIVLLNLEGGWWQRVRQWSFELVRRQLEFISCPKSIHHHDYDDDEDDWNAFL
jgi:hypothetical protein